MHRRARRRFLVAVGVATAVLIMGACASPTSDAVLGSLTLRDVTLVLRDDGQIAATFEARNDSSVDRAVTIRWPVAEALRERSVPVPANGTTVVGVDDGVILSDLAASPGDEIAVTVTEGYFFREDADTQTLVLVVRTE